MIVVALGAVQVFVIPRRLDITTYGEYRLFIVYIAYIGVLHFGFADGAFVRWSGRAPAVIHSEWRRLIGWMLGMQAALAALAGLISLGIGNALAATYLIAFAACACFSNATTLSAYALQAAGEFRAAGAVAVIAPASFVAAVLIVPMHSLAEVLAAYAGSFVLSAIAGATFVMQMPLPAAPSDERISIATLFRTGFHVLGANLAAGLAQSADRVLVSVIVPITSMALYGFASSVAVAGTAATQTMQRVALSHAARRDGEDRAQFLGRFYDLTLAAFGVALVGFPFFEHTVATTLPVYATALPIVRAFVAGAPFWIGLHVVLVGTLQSHLLVRRQFALELGGAALVVVACSVCLAMHTPLWAVATAGSASAFVTWCAGVAIVNHDVPAARTQGAVRFAIICAAQIVAMGIAFTVTPDWRVQTALYLLLAAVPTYGAIRAARAPWS